MSIAQTGRRRKGTEVPPHPVGKEAGFACLFACLLRGGGVGVQEEEKTGLVDTQPVYASFGPSGVADLKNPFSVGADGLSAAV